MFIVKLAHIIKNTGLSFKIALSACFIVVGLCFFVQQAWCKPASGSAYKNKRVVTAQSVYAMDSASKKVLFSRNARKKFQPASTVKLLTGLVVLENIDINERVLINSTAVGVEPTKAGLTLGATYSVRELLEVLLATSANDAGVALACAVSGSEKKFSVLMNKKAKSLGCLDSNFTNATGLPNKLQLTTARDMSIITRSAFNNTFIKNVMGKKSVTIKGSDGKSITRKNHNKLLWRIKYPKILGKTGYTRTAGHCYAGIAYYNKRYVSVVIMKSRKPWSDLYSIFNIKPKKKS